MKEIKKTLTHDKIAAILFLTVIVVNWFAGSSPGWDVTDEVISIVGVMGGIIILFVGLYKEHHK